MKKTTGIDFVIEILTFLNSIKRPISVEDFINRDLTGDSIADTLLKSTALMMLEFMKRDGIIESDNLTVPGAQIYGLTSHGSKTLIEFILLNNE